MHPSYNLYNNTKNKSPKSKNNNKIYLSQSFSSLKKTRPNQSQRYQINCNTQKKEKNLEANEDINIIQTLWNDLGVLPEYREEFKNYLLNLDNEEEKNEVISYEKNQLRKFRESLMKLTGEISNRDNNIFKLKKYCVELDKYALDKNMEEVPSDLFEKIQSTIKLYRINTVNVINKIMRLRELFSYYELNKKFDLSQVNKSYLYHKYYTLSMLKDIKFINNSVLFNYLETNDDAKKTDLFFSNCKNIITNNNTKLKLNISLELKNAINKCKYIILQDKLFFKMKTNKNFIPKRNILSPKSFRVQSTKSMHSNYPKKSQSEIYLSNNKNEQKYYTMFGHNKVNLSRTLYYLKHTMGDKYEKMFFNAQNKNNDKKNMDIINKYFCFNNKNNIDDLSYNNDINNNINNNNDGDINNKVDIEFSDIKNKNSGINSINNTLHMEQLNKNCEDIKIEKMLENINESDNRNVIKNKKIIKKNNKGNKKKEKESNDIIKNSLDNEDNKANIKNIDNDLNIIDNSDKKEEIKEKEINIEHKEEQNIENDKKNENEDINKINNISVENDKKDKKGDIDKINNESIENENNNKSQEIINNNNDEMNNDINNNINNNKESKIELTEEKKEENEGSNDKKDNNLSKSKNTEENNIENINENNKSNIDIEKSNKNNEEEEQKEEKEEKEQKEELNESKLKEVENNEYKEKEEPSNDKLKDNENGELEEKKEDQKDNDELKEKEELKDNYELKEKEEQKDNGEFGEVRENKEEIAKENENINNDEKNISKTKLLQYREYTEEEQRKINKDDDEFESIDYDNI